MERNALRAGLCRRAEEWRWGSLSARRQSDGSQPALLSDWPLPVPDDWLAWVNEAQTDVELEALRRSAQRGQPFGDEFWVKRTTARLGLESTIRKRGRPRKPTEKGS